MTGVNLLLGLVQALIWPATLVWLILLLRSSIEGVLRRVARVQTPGAVAALGDTIREKLEDASRTGNAAARDRLQSLEGELDQLVAAYADQYHQRLRYQQHANQAADQLQRLLSLIRTRAHGEPSEDIISDTNRLIGRIQGWYLG